MAIAKANGNAPYIHSNIDNFAGGVGTDLGHIGDAVVNYDEIRSTIQSLKGIRDRLKEEAEKFLLGMHTDEVNANLLRLPDTYAGLAADIIQDPNLIKTLVTHFDINTKDIQEKVFKKGNKNSKRISQNILKEIEGKNIVSASELARIISNAFTYGSGSGELTNTGMRITRFFAFDESLKDEIEKAYNEGVYDRLTSAKAKIVDVIKNLLISSSLVQQNPNASVDNFIDNFKQIFVARAKAEIKIFPKDLTPEQYVEKLRNILKKDITKDIQDLRNAAGLINENILAAVYKADNTTTIEFTPVGTMTENDIIKKFPSLQKMNTHHLDSKQSQSDMILQNAEGMIVRAQSKTSIGSYKIEDKETERILNYLQRSANIYTLLEKLQKVDVFPIGDIDQICYVLANALWFNTHISVSGIREHGKFTFKKGDVYPEVMSDVANALNAELARQIPSFMGISLRKTADEIIMDTGGSNIFYIENGRLIPTYLELDEVIKDLEEYEQGLEKVKSFKITIEQRSGGVKWQYGRAVQFWTEKYKGGKYDPIPGFKQGEAAISSISVHGNFYAISNFTSYTIGK